MKICISSEGDSLDSRVDPRFGRCRYFLIVDGDTNYVEVVENTNIDAVGGAGIQAGQLAADKQVAAVLTGNVGPNAFQTLHATGIEVITGVSGTVREAMDRYHKGQFRAAEGPTTGPKSGTELLK